MKAPQAALSPPSRAKIRHLAREPAQGEQEPSGIHGGRSAPSQVAAAARPTAGQQLPATPPPPSPVMRPRPTTTGAPARLQDTPPPPGHAARASTSTSAADIERPRRRIEEPQPAGTTPEQPVRAARH